MNWTVLSLAVGAVALSGCTIDPPIPLESESGFLEQHPFPEKGWDSKKFPRMAIGPISASYAAKSDRLYGDVAASASAAKKTEDEPLHFYDQRLDPRARLDLQEKLASVLTWALYDPAKSVRTIGAGTIRQVKDDDLAGVPDDKRDAAKLVLRQRYLCEAATALDSPLVVQVDLTQNRISYVEWTWMSLVDVSLFWGFGFVPAMFFPDEVYELQLSARVTIVHARTQTIVYQTTHTATHQDTFNEPERGWPIFGFGFPFHVLFVDGDTFDAPYEALWPHALKKLESALVADLRSNLPKQLDLSRKDLTEGTDESSRVFALVIGHNGDFHTNAAHVALTYAENDASEVAAALRAANGLAVDETLRVIARTNNQATPDEIHDSLKVLGPRLLGKDVLIVYYSGLGTTDGSGEPVLVLGGGDKQLPVKTLAEWCQATLVEHGNKPNVVFVLDTSFAPNAKADDPNCRSLAQPGSPPLRQQTYLEPLANKINKWTVLVAAGASQSAFEYLDPKSAETRHGFLTQSVLAGLAGAADARRDGKITTGELFDYVERQVPQTAANVQFVAQKPEHHGTSVDFFVTRRGQPVKQ